MNISYIREFLCMEQHRSFPWIPEERYIALREAVINRVPCSSPAP